MSDQTVNEMSDGGGDEPELFPLGSLPGDGLSLKNLLKPGMKQELTVSMMSAEVPSPKDKGLLDPEKEGLLLVTFEVANYHPVPVREGDKGERKLKGYKIRQNIRPIYIEPVTGEAGTIEAGFAAMLEDNPGDAGALLDRLKARAEKALQKA